MSGNPVISVIMSVYNAERETLRQSIDSVLQQTYTNFEFIIINDGSTNGCDADIKSAAERDSRICFFSHENKGLTRSLNFGISHAKGDFIARQDADDISYPDRFEKQVKLFSNDKVVLVGGNADDVYDNGLKGVWGSFPDHELQRIVFIKAPFPHSTVMMRASVCRAAGGYDESFVTAQDMELWMRLAKRGELAMVAEPVILRRAGGESISRKRRWRQFRDGMRARWRHNRGMSRVRAVYTGLRGLLIGLMPVGLALGLRRVMKGGNR